jgi:hypothetical protein
MQFNLSIQRQGPRQLNTRCRDPEILQFPNYAPQTDWIAHTIQSCFVSSISQPPVPILSSSHLVPNPGAHSIGQEEGYTHCESDLVRKRYRCGAVLTPHSQPFCWIRLGACYPVFGLVLSYNGIHSLVL